MPRSAGILRDLKHGAEGGDFDFVYEGPAKANLKTGHCYRYCDSRPEVTPQARGGHAHQEAPRDPRHSRAQPLPCAGYPTTAAWQGSCGTLTR